MMRSRTTEMRQGLVAYAHGVRQPDYQWIDDFVAAAHRAEVTA